MFCIISSFDVFLNVRLVNGCAMLMKLFPTLTIRLGDHKSVLIQRWILNTLWLDALFSRVSSMRWPHCGGMECFILSDRKEILLCLTWLRLSPPLTIFICQILGRIFHRLGFMALYISNLFSLPFFTGFWFWVL